MEKMPMNIRAIVYHALSISPVLFSAGLAVVLCWYAGQGVAQSLLTGLSVAGALHLIFTWTLGKHRQTARSSRWLGLATIPFALYLCGRMLWAVYLVATNEQLRQLLVGQSAGTEIVLTIIAITSLTWACIVAIARVVRSFQSESGTARPA